MREKGRHNDHYCSSEMVGGALISPTRYELESSLKNGKQTKRRLSLYRRVDNVLGSPYQSGRVKGQRGGAFGWSSLFVLGEADFNALTPSRRRCLLHTTGYNLRFAVVQSRPTLSFRARRTRAPKLEAQANPVFFALDGRAQFGTSGKTRTLLALDVPGVCSRNLNA